MNIFITSHDRNVTRTLSMQNTGFICKVKHHFIYSCIHSLLDKSEE